MKDGLSDIVIRTPKRHVTYSVTSIQLYFAFFYMNIHKQEARHAGTSKTLFFSSLIAVFFS